MRKRSATYRLTRIAATFVAAIACAQPAWSEDAPLTPLNAPPTTSTAPADRYEAAAELFRNRKWREAVTEFQTFADERPDDPRVEQARFFSAESFHRDGQYLHAAQCFRNLLATTTDEATREAAQFRMAEGLYLSKFNDGTDFNAAVALETFVEQRPQHPAAPRAWYYLTESAYAAGNFERAESAAAFLTAAYPEDANVSRAALLQAASLLQLGRTHEARTVLTSLAATPGAPLDPTIDVLDGSLDVSESDELLAAGNLDEAEARFKRFRIEHKQHELASYCDYRLAEISAAQGNWNEAAIQFAAVLARNDLSEDLKPLAWLAQVQALAQDRDWADVLTVAAAAQQRLPDWSRRYEFDYLRGRAHLARAEMQPARDAFAGVLVAPTARGTEVAALAQYMTAETHFLQRHYAEALVEYAKAGEHSHPHWQAAAQLQSGKCCEQLQRPTDAQAAYETLLRDFADSPFAAEARSRRDACLRQASAPAAAQRK